MYGLADGIMPAIRTRLISGSKIECNKGTVEG